MVDSDFGGLQPKSTEQKPAEAASKSILPAQPKPPAGKEEPPVAVAADFGSGAAPQLTDTAKPAYLRYTLPEQKLYTPVSMEYYDTIRVAPENRNRERIESELLQKHIAPVTAEFTYAPVQKASARSTGGTKKNEDRWDFSLIDPDSIYALGIGPVSEGKLKGMVESGQIELLSPGTSQQFFAIWMPGWDAEKYKRYGGAASGMPGGFPSADIPRPPTQSELEKAERESILNAVLQEYIKYSMLPDNPVAASAALTLDGERTRVGGVLAGTAKNYTGELISAAGTALEFIAQYGHTPAEIEMMQFNPAMEIPERDISLIKEYATDPMRDFGDELSLDGWAQIDEQKEGLGPFGRFAVDLGSAATELVLDLGLSAITGGGIALPAAIRAFGGAATEARADGASLEEQMMYATTSATLSYGVESVCNLAFKGIKMIKPGISDKFLMEVIEKAATKLASTPEGAQLLLKFGTIAVSGISESGEDLTESVLQPFLKKLIYDNDAETILDDPGLLADYMYEAMLSFILGSVSGSMNVETNADTDAYVRTNADPGVESAVQQYVEAVQTGLEQNTDYQPAVDTQWEGLDPAELDFDPYELFSASEDSAASNTDTAADSPMLSEGIENTEAFEQSFLSGLQSGEESGIMQIESHEKTVEPVQTAKAAEQAQKPLTAQERLALLGAALLDKGGMPNDAQLAAMGMDEATARGIQSLVLLSKENNPAARRKVEAMIDQTAPEVQGRATVETEGRWDVATFTSWDEMGAICKGSIIQFVKENKPRYSPDVKKWFANGGSISIDNSHGKKTWIYTSVNGDSVPYVDGDIKFPQKYLHPIIPSVNIGRFSGDRQKDINRMRDILEECYGISEIPDGYVVHHDVEDGILQLVDIKIHREFTHIGGYSKYK